MGVGDAAEMVAIVSEGYTFAERNAARMTAIWPEKLEFEFDAELFNLSCRPRKRKSAQGLAPRKCLFGCCYGLPNISGR